MDVGKWCRLGWVVEGHAHVFQVVIHYSLRFAAHELNRVLVAQPVRALDGAVEVVACQLSQTCCPRGTDASLALQQV